MGWLWGKGGEWIWQVRARPLCSLWGDHPTCPRSGLAPTWVVASDSRGTAEDLPQQRGVLPAVLGEHILQGLRPVELIEDDGGCGEGRALG